MIKRKRKVIMLGTICISIAVMICVYFILMFTGVINSNVDTLEITTSSESIEYNGEELSCHDYEITKGSLHKGHTIDIKFLRSITNVGQITNEVSVSVLDSNNYDVTDEYDLKINTGLLTVLKREITISTSSKSKAYDGTVLKSSDWYITKGNVLNNHTVSVNVYGSILDVGQTPNICRASVYNEKGIDVTTNYGITFDYGTLTIERKTIKFSSQDITKTFDGKLYTPDTTKDFTFEGKLLNSNHRIIYEASPTIVNVGWQKYMFSATIVDEYGNDITSDYEVSYEYGQIEVVSKKISLRTGSINKTYDGKEVLCEEFEITNNVKLIDGYEIECTDFNSYKDSGTYENKCNIKILYNGKDNNNYVIDDESLEFGLIVINPIELTISCKNIIKEYDDEYSLVPELIYYDNLLINGDYLVYERNYSKYKNVGTYELKEDDYLDFDIKNQDGDSNKDNYNIIYKLGNLIINKKKIVVDLGIEDISYDGKAHGWDNEIYNPKISNFDEDKFIIEFEFDNVTKITNVGSLDFLPLSVYIYNKELHLYNESQESNTLEELSSNFSISYNNYKLNIKPRDITVTTESGWKYYDGEVLTFKNNLAGFWISNGSLVEGHTDSHNSCKSEILEEGKIDNLIDYTIKDEIGEDVSYNYNIEIINGKLEIKKINVKISLIDWEKAYDDENYLEPGEVIDSSKYIKTVENSNSDHEIKLIYIGLDNKEVGTYTVTEEDIYLKVVENVDGQENDVTSAYTLELEHGCTIVINKRVITIATGSKTSLKYPLQHKEFSYTGNLLEGHELIGEFVVLDYIGTIENSATFLVQGKDDGMDKTQNYIIHYSFGTLTVKSAPGSEDIYGYGIAPEYLAYEYDGVTTVQDYVDEYNKALKVGTAHLSGLDQLINDYKLTYTATVKLSDTSYATSTNVGKYTLEIDTFELYYNTNPVTEDYKISYSPNTLQIYNYKLDVTTQSIDVYVYDGKILNSELTHSGLFEGHSIYINKVPYISDVGNVTDNKVEFIIKDSSGKDITDQYYLNITYGKLSIKQAKTIIIDLSDLELVYEDETVTYNLAYLASYITSDALCDEDEFEELTLTYTPSDGINPADYNYTYKIYKEIDNVKYDVSNLYSIEFIFE